MLLSHKLRFALRILAYKKSRVFLTIISITIGTAIFFLFRNFSVGLETAVLEPILESSSPTTLVVRPDIASIGFFTGKNKIEQKEIEQIRQIKGVQSINRQLLLGFPNSISVSLFGFQFHTDAPIFGIDEQILMQDKIDLSLQKDKIPVVISPRLLDLFNTSLADSIAAVPHLDQDDIIGKEIKLLFGKSSFFRVNLGKQNPIEKIGYVAGISAKVPAIGISIPLETAFQLNETLGGVPQAETVFQQLLVEAKDIGGIPHIQTQVKEMGLTAESFKEMGGEIRSIAATVRIILFSASSSILLVALFSLLSLISVFVIEQQRNIGILRAIGARRKDIFTIILGMAIIITIIGLILGVIIGIITSLILNPILFSYLPELSFLPETFFPISITFTFYLCASVLILTTLSASFSARSAANLEPLKAIWE